MVVVLVGLIALLSGCSAGGTSGGNSAADAPTTTLSASSRADDDEQATEACETGRRTIRVAVEAYYAKVGRYPVDVDELVDEGYLLALGEPHPEWTIEGDGTVVGTCP